jgi:RNA polymerase sigma factor (sigma-70 family)
MPRTVRPARDVATEADLMAIAGPIRQAVSSRVAAGRGLPSEDVEDVVQETLSRVWAVRWRLERATLLPYGLAVARNLITSAERQELLRDRYGPRLVDPPPDGDPTAGLIAAEERAALLRAVAALRAEDRHLLVDHEVHGVEARRIASAEGIAANTVAARLARARGRLRVEHLLALRNVTLPTSRCRGVLDAISLGDRSRQRTLLAAEHLLQCETCAGLAEPLLTRRRSLTGLAPVALLLALPGKLWGWVRAHPLPATGAGAVTVAAAVAVVVLVTGDDPAPPPPVAAPPAAVPATLSVAGSRVLPADRVSSMTADVGRPAVARDVPVESVPADEGFWVGAGPGRRVWVQLRTASESTVRVRPGERASFTGTVVAAPAGMPARVGLSTAEGAAELRTAGAYVLVDPAHLTTH